MESFEINSNRDRLVQIETMSGEIEKGYLIGLMPDDVIVLDKQDEGCFIHIC